MFWRENNNKMLRKTKNRESKFGHGIMELGHIICDDKKKKKRCYEIVSPYHCLHRIK